MTIMDQLDSWVRSRSSGVYHVEGADVSVATPIQQVRAEIAELVDVICWEHGEETKWGRRPGKPPFDGDVLEIGLGIHGGTNVLWHLLFSGRIVTIEALQYLVDKFIALEKPDRQEWIIGRSQDHEPCQQAGKLGPYVFLHIDGDHGHAAVKCDYSNYAPLVSSGGMIVLHDLLTPGVSRFVAELEAAGHKINRIVHSEHVGIAWEIKNP